ncbi:MAG: pyridine nucleotide-disulfide oxidoreductase, partial [Chloroflexi bacterium]|nr:pyridine nucleotide-disulfide oxidoreductase [Chloroflexota bacterium]
MARVNVDVLVIGGGIAGRAAAITGKAFYLTKEFILVRKESQVIDPCGIPYIFGSPEGASQIIVPDEALGKAGVALKIDEVVSINPKEKVAQTADGTDIYFDKIILALGAQPVIPHEIGGTHLKNVFTIPREKNALDRLIAQVRACQRVVIFGGGFIGVEVADEIRKIGKGVTVVQPWPHCLWYSFDEEVAAEAEAILRTSGIRVITGMGIREVIGETSVEGVLLRNGERIEADGVILTVGHRSNSDLARRSGIAVNDAGFITVDDYMRTSNPDILAVGDCSENKSFITGIPTNIFRASTACTEGRVAAMNLFRLSSVKTFSGTIAIMCVKVGNSTFGSAGMIERLAKERGFNIVTASYSGIDRHPEMLPDAHTQSVKLIVSRESGMILGGEVIGGVSDGEIS